MLVCRCWWPILVPCMAWAELLCHSAGRGRGQVGSETRSWRVASYGDAKWEVAATLLGHYDAVCSVAFSADGKRVVTGSADGTAIVWRNASSGQGFNDSNATSTEATGSQQYEPDVWKVETVLGSRYLDPLVRDVAWSPDGDQVLVIDVNGTSRLWGPNVFNAEASESATKQTEAISYIGCFDDSQFARKKYYGNKAACSFDFMTTQAKEDGKTYFAMARHKIEFGHAFTIARIVGAPLYGTDPCGTPCTDNSSRLCGCANEVYGPYANSDCPSGMRLMATYAIAQENSTNGRERLVDQAEGHVNISGAAADAAPWLVISQLSGSGDPAWAAHWPPNGTSKVLVGAPDRTACLRQPADEDQAVSLVACMLDSEGRAPGTYALLGRIWQTENTMPPSPWTLAAQLEAPPHLITAARWSPDGLRIMTGGIDGIALIFQVAGPDIHSGGRLRWDALTSCQAHTEAIWAVAWSPDGKRVLTGSKDGSASIWLPQVKDPAQWDRPAGLDELPGDVPSDMWGRLTGVVEQAGSKGYPWIFLAELNGLSQMGWLSGWSVATVAAWSPDGHSIFTGSADGTARIWQESVADPKQWQVVATLRGHVSKVWTVAWSADSRQLLTGSHDGSVRIWRLRDDAASPETTREKIKDTRDCQFVRYQGFRCAAAGGPVEDMLQDYNGTLEDCKRQCCALGQACAGFEVVGGPATTLEASVGTCFFRAGALQEPLPWLSEPARDCYKHVRPPANASQFLYDNYPHALV